VLRTIAEQPGSAVATAKSAEVFEGAQVSFLDHVFGILFRYE
jgi:hypothetical protein